jgi:hypothetical protein
MSGPAATGELARVRPGDLLAALGELGCGWAAQVYAACGYPVVPMHAIRPGGDCTCGDPTCSDSGKHPRLAGWQRLASTDPATVRGWWRRWPTANLGLATGRRFDVLDLDGAEGVEALRAALQIAAWEHPGPVARSGGGGWHLLYAPTGLGNRVKLLAGMDWRGRGGLIVAPPSRHTTGGRYAWQRPLTAELPQVPAGLWRLLAPPRPAPLPPTPVRRRAGYGAAALAGETAKVRGCAAGRRQWTLNIAAFKLGQLVAVGLLSEAEVWAELAAAAAASGLGEREITRTIRRGLADGHAKPTHRRGGRR